MDLIYPHEIMSKSVSVSAVTNSKSFNIIRSAIILSKDFRKGIFGVEKAFKACKVCYHEWPWGKKRTIIRYTRVNEKV